ncbi:protein of unknown function [Fibrobacter sp. UWOV1]|nr:protein of unknown function [Fibrobacter sp. UWOV1]
MDLPKISILYHMKPTLSFVLQLPPSTAYAKLESVVENLLKGVCMMLDSGKVKFSLFLDGPTLEVATKVPRPLMLGKLRRAIEDGSLELLGGGFYDPMLPLFPTELQSMQLKKHGKLLWKYFGIEPSGYFNSSMVWEMEMTELLEKHRFEYALVQEASLQDALGRTTPVSGWYTVEDKGSLMRVVPVSQKLSDAISNDDFQWEQIAEPYCRGGKAAVVGLNIPPQPGDIIPFFERLIEFVEMNEISTKTVASAVTEQNAEGRVSFLLSSGRKIGLPAAAKTCRELLIRRPEVNLLHKMLLAQFRRAAALLKGRERDDFFEMLLPAMSPIYYRDMQDSEGMRTPMVRWWGTRFLLQAANRLTDLVSFDGIRLDIADFMLEGYKSIWAENHSYSFLLNYRDGGILNILNAKDAENSVLGAWRDDGNPAVGFLDFMIPNVELKAEKLDQILSDREGMLTAAYDYQIKRHDAGTDIALLSDQHLVHGGQTFAIHAEKNFELSSTGSQFSVEYKLLNNSPETIKGFFGTLLDTGLLACGHTDKDILIDGVPLKFNFRDPLIFPDACSFEIADKTTTSRIELVFEKKTSVLVSPIFGASAQAAPEALQGIRVFPFWKMNLAGEAEFSVLMTVKISKR